MSVVPFVLICSLSIILVQSCSDCPNDNVIAQRIELPNHSVFVRVSGVEAFDELSIVYVDAAQECAFLCDKQATCLIWELRNNLCRTAAKFFIIEDQELNRDVFDGEIFAKIHDVGKKFQVSYADTNCIDKFTVAEINEDTVRVWMKENAAKRPEDSNIKADDLTSRSPTTIDTAGTSNSSLTSSKYSMDTISTAPHGKTTTRPGSESTTTSTVKQNESTRAMETESTIHSSTKLADDPGYSSTQTATTRETVTTSLLETTTEVSSTSTPSPSTTTDPEFPQAGYLEMSDRRYRVPAGRKLTISLNMGKETSLIVYSGCQVIVASQFEGGKEEKIIYKSAGEFPSSHHLIDFKEGIRSLTLYGKCKIDW